MRHKKTSKLRQLLHTHIILNEKEKRGVLRELGWLYKRAYISFLFICLGIVLLPRLLPGDSAMYESIVGLPALLLFLISWLNAERQGDHLPVFSQYTSHLKWALYRHVSVLLFFLSFVVVVAILFALF